MLSGQGAGRVAPAARPGDPGTRSRRQTCVVADRFARMIAAERALAAAAPLIEDAVGSGRIPGAVLAVGGGEGVPAFAAWGSAQVEPAREPISVETWFDLASLTKPIFTASTILRLVDDGRIGLETPLAEIMPDLRAYDLAAPERSLTIGACLAHQTFLPAVEPLYTYGQDPATLRAFVLQRAWPHGPQVYSDINYILAGIAIERLTGRPLDEVEVGPGLGFHPRPDETAATENCPWRGRVLRGEVHDENAFALGGPAGHAGLFGTAAGVIGFANRLMRREGWSEAAVAAVTTRIGRDRSVGWELAHPGWHGGAAASPTTVGHLGFTGTGLWIDLEHGLAWTLLTNRVHPSRHSESGIMALRRAVGEAVVTAITC